MVLVLKLNLYQIILLEKPAVEGACPTIKTRKDAGKHSLKVGPPWPLSNQFVEYLFLIEHTFFQQKKEKKTDNEGKAK